MVRYPAGEEGKTAGKAARGKYKALKGGKLLGGMILRPGTGHEKRGKICDTENARKGACPGKVQKFEIDYQYMVKEGCKNGCF